MDTLTGCSGHDPTPTLEIRTCPQCGAEVEVFSTDASVKCDNCGFEVFNNKVSCVKWCKYARLCMGEDAYKAAMEVANRQS